MPRPHLIPGPVSPYLQSAVELCTSTNLREVKALLSTFRQGEGPSEIFFASSSLRASAGRRVLIVQDGGSFVTVTLDTSSAWAEIHLDAGSINCFVGQQ